MLKKWVKYLFIVLYELGAFAAIYFVIKIFAESVS